MIFGAIECPPTEKHPDGGLRVRSLHPAGDFYLFTRDVAGLRLTTDCIQYLKDKILHLRDKGVSHRRNIIEVLGTDQCNCGTGCVGESFRCQPDLMAKCWSDSWIPRPVHPPPRCTTWSLSCELFRKLSSKSAAVLCPSFRIYAFWYCCCNNKRNCSSPTNITTHQQKLFFLVTTLICDFFLHFQGWLPVATLVSTYYSGV